MDKRIFVTILGISAILLMAGMIFADPFGAGITVGDSSNGNSSAPSHNNATAGNVTEIIISGDSLSQTWQGYYGNVSGALILTDGNRNTFYNWTSLTAEGEVFASTNSTLTWTGIKCFNFTDLDANELNLTNLEIQYNMSSNDVDNINNTFGRNDHSSFQVSNVSFTTGQCNNTKLLDNTGAKTFQEVLLYEPNTNSVVFTSILLDNQLGFDGSAHDFEMLVPENGHNGDTSTTQYFFYVELSA